MGNDLIVHAGAKRVTLAELREIKAPAPMGARHYPVSHIDLVDATRHELAKVGLAPNRESYAVGRGGNSLFATWDLLPEGDNAPSLIPAGVKERGLSVGFRHANDQSLAIEYVAGARIFVCDNLAFSGDTILLHRMHTKNVHLRDEVGRGVTKLLDRYSNFEANMSRLENTDLTDKDAKALMVDAFMAVKVLAPKYLKAVYEWYFENALQHPEFTDVAPRTAWGLLNSFTRTLKDIQSENVKYIGTARVGRFFGLRSDVRDAKIGDVIDADYQDLTE